MISLQFHCFLILCPVKCKVLFLLIEVFYTWTPFPRQNFTIFDSWPLLITIIAPNDVWFHAWRKFLTTSELLDSFPNLFVKILSWCEVISAKDYSWTDAVPYELWVNTAFSFLILKIKPHKFKNKMDWNIWIVCVIKCMYLLLL